jgi:hypothetical protein
MRVTTRSASSKTAAVRSVSNERWISPILNPNGMLRTVSNKSAVDTSHGPMIRRNAARISVTRMAADKSAPPKPSVRALMPSRSATLCALTVCSPIVANTV